MTSPSTPAPASPPLAPLARPGTLLVTWLIARREALESLRDRTTLMVSTLFTLAVPTALVVGVVRPMAVGGTGGPKGTALGAAMAAYILVVGLMPSTGSISIASGAFAGEKEKGNLAPLLATPASNEAIFGGKVLGAVLPALLYAALAELLYLAEIALVIGADRLRLLPVALSLSMVLLVPAVALLGAAVASLVSSRVRTYNGAQTLTSLLLLPVMALLFGLAAKMQEWGAPALFATLALLCALDLLLIGIGAVTWRREEVMAHR